MRQLTRHSILNGNTPVPTTLLRWHAWWLTAALEVARTQVGAVEVATVFVGIDRGRAPAPPLVFASRVMRGAHCLYEARYATWDEAEAGHAAMVELVRDGSTEE
jgi:hypothetical protein